MKILPMKNNRVLIQVFEVSVTIALLCLLFFYADKFTKRPETKYKQFFEIANDIDVVMVGSSHVVEGFYPLQLWKDYGYTSYNFGNAALGPVYTYWIFRLGLQYCHPKIAILDAYGASKSFDKNDVDGLPELLHGGLDCYPLSIEKYKAITDLTSIRSEQMEFLFPFFLYHSRWSEDLIGQYYEEEQLRLSKQMGANYVVKLDESRTITLMEGPELLDMDTMPTATEYIYKFIELCRENDITPILTFIPFDIPEDRQSEYYTAKYIAEREDIPFIDMVQDGFFNTITDCQDPNEHLNSSGAFKATDYLGKYLDENFHIQNHRGEEGFERWDDYFVRWREEVVLPQVLEQNDLPLLLMQMNDPNLGVVIRGYNGLEFNELEQNLIRQLPNLLTLEILEESDSEKNCDIKLHLYQMDTGEEIGIREFKRNKYMDGYKLLD